MKKKPKLPTKRSLGGLRRVQRTSDNAPDYLGTMHMLKSTLLVLLKQLNETAAEEVICKIAGWENSNANGAFLTVMMPFLGETGKDLNEDIGELVKKGLDVEIQQAMDVLRVVGNNAVHPGQIDIKDNKSIAVRLFDLLNLIVERRISTPKKIAALFDELPETARKAIKDRDEA
jgi:DNA-binding protein